MGVELLLTDKVNCIASDIVDQKRIASPNLHANVSPTFTRGAACQRVPVRIDFASVPDKVKLVAG